MPRGLAGVLFLFQGFIHGVSWNSQDLLRNERTVEFGLYVQMETQKCSSPLVSNMEGSGLSKHVYEADVNSGAGQGRRSLYFLFRSVYLKDSCHIGI